MLEDFSDCNFDIVKFIWRFSKWGGFELGSSEIQILVFVILEHFSNLRTFGPNPYSHQIIKIDI
jgi:hypothetical protein